MDRCRRFRNSISRLGDLSNWTVAPPPRMISKDVSVVNMFNAAPNMGGNMSHFMDCFDAMEAFEGGDGGVVRPRRIRWWDRMMIWDACRGGFGNVSSGREV